MDTSLFGGDEEADGDRLDRALGTRSFSVGFPEAPDLPTETAVDLVYPRLIPEGMATDELGFGYTTNPLPGTVTAYVYDLPNLFYYLTPARIAEHGAEVLADAAYRNLREVDFGQPEPLDNDVWALTEYHSGAAALILPEVMWRYTGQEEFSDGVLFSPATNDLLMYHVVRDAGIVAALEHLASLAATAFEDDERRRVTPSAYWWDGGMEVYRLTEVDGEQITVYVSGAFEETFERLRAELPD